MKKKIEKVLEKWKEQSVIAKNNINNVCLMTVEKAVYTTKHNTLCECIKDLGKILNSESSSKTGTLPNNEGKEKVCDLSVHCRESRLAGHCPYLKNDNIKCAY